MQPRRLDQILSRYGYSSRSEARALIKSNRVLVAGKAAKAADQKVDPLLVRIDGEPIEAPEGLLALFHKPAGYVCTHDESEGPTIYDILPPRWSRRNPPVTSVGRLDKDTTGALLLTDDGALVQRWTSPRHKVPKLYEVTLDQDLAPELVSIFATGELILPGEEKPCAPATLQITSRRTARLELIEGKYHQVKRMFALHGYQVLQLHRSQFGSFELGTLQPGQWTMLDASAI